MTTTTATSSTANSTMWHEFAITGPNGNQIPLRQVDANLFNLGEVSITFTGDTGLGRYVESGKLSQSLLDEVRTIDNVLLPESDLASVPGPMRWFTNTYGPHTPAALIHDYLIPDKGVEPKIPEIYADRYFRFMLGSVGVPFFKRFIMWAAVAMRTRLHAPRLLPRVLLVTWALASLVGLVLFAITAPSVLWGTADIAGSKTTAIFALSCIAPFACSVLWGRQWGAGITAAMAAPWLLPAALVTVIGYVVYWALERIGSIIGSGIGFAQRLVRIAFA